MNKIKKEFIGKRVVAAPESAMQVLSMWLMKKSRKVTSVNTNMKDKCVSLPKTQQQLAQMDDEEEDDQPLVLVTAPTGSAAFKVGGSTIHSAFLLYDKSRTKPSWEKHSIMQLKLQKLMLPITDEISMVSFKQYQQMNKTMSIVKGTCDGN